MLWSSNSRYDKCLQLTIDSGISSYQHLEDDSALTISLTVADPDVEDAVDGIDFSYTYSDQDLITTNFTNKSADGSNIDLVIEFLPDQNGSIVSEIEIDEVDINNLPDLN